MKTINISELIDSGEASIQTGPFGTQLKAKDYVESGTPVINVKNVGFGTIRHAGLEYVNDKMREKLSAHILQKGDIVFGRKGAVERHALIYDHGDGWIQGSDCLRLRINSNRVNNRFVSYYLRTQAHQDWMQALCSFGATMASLNQGIVKRISLPLPSTQTQDKVAAILTSYDDLIETNNQRIQLLEKMAEEIYKEWFVRLRFPGHETVKVVKGVPSGWSTSTIKSLISRKPTPKKYKEKEVLGEGRVPVLDQSTKDTLGFHNGDVDFKATNDDPIIVFGDHSCKMLLMESDFSLAENMIPFTPKTKDVLAHYLFYTVKGLAKTTEYKRHWGDLVIKEVFVAPRNLQIEFGDLVKTNLKEINLLKEVNQNLSDTRDKLLPRLISGKLSVENLDINFPPSMEDALA
ncbi:restriction endonuclease subunit S [Leucothrix pacifica]|uniref:Restriction endonuclease subunit S n=1 Tax=Leucothrix pacifica TaxID=1247513 RepID=A0A317C423_9GAMM|nr:restriction endonuclease subunit S [Leucothrix pacifica]PWQ93029.1 restriction endonuclease subunit S [Leucothrix pacifica]